MGHLRNLVATASERSPALGGKDVSPTLEEATTEKLPLRRDEVIDAGAGDEKPLEIARDCGSTSGNAFEPSCMRPNLQPNIFWLKVRTKGPQPSILVRTFSQFTTSELWLIPTSSKSAC